MAQRPEYPPGEAAPATGIYKQLNIFGRPTGIRVTLMEKYPFPKAPVGHSWTPVEEDSAEC
jgi:hypothetical protein